MPLKRPERRQKPKLNIGSKHPSSYTGTRLIPSLSLSPANLLQLQQAVGNQFVAKLIGDHWKVVRAARRDRIEAEPGSKSEEAMQRHPRYGDWHFQYVVDSNTNRTSLYWVTLSNYKNRQRHVMIDPNTLKPHDLLGADLGASERKTLMEWAMLMFYEQMSGNLKAEQHVSDHSRHAEAPQEEIELPSTDSPPSDDE